MAKKLPARYIVKRRLLDIREQAVRLIATADEALREIADVEKVRVQKWRCLRCGFVEWFTKPVALETCDPCPKCGGVKFAPAGEEPLAD